MKKTKRKPARQSRPEAGQAQKTKRKPGQDALARLEAFHSEFTEVCAAWCLGNLSCKGLAQALLELQAVVSYPMCEDKVLTRIEGLLETCRLRILDLDFTLRDIVVYLNEIRELAKGELLKLGRIAHGIYS